MNGTDSGFPNVSYGDVVEFFENQQIITAVCLATKKSKVKVLTETSREINLVPRRILHLTRHVFPEGTPRKDIIPVLKAINLQRKALIDHIDLETAWKRLHVTCREIPFPEFAVSVFQTNAHDDQLAALKRKLISHKIFFTLTDSSVSIHSPEKVAAAQKALDEARNAELKKQRLSKWLTERLRGKPVEDPPGTQRLINAMEALTINSPDQPDRAWMRDILKSAGVGGDDLFDQLVTLEVFDPDENLDLRHHSHPGTYTGQPALPIPPVAKYDATSGRADLRHLACFTVDNADTLDMDDALSLEVYPDGSATVGIHITDVAEYITPESRLDLEARERSQTLYMPDLILPMFPVEFSENIASLRAGDDRIALSTLVKISPQLTITEHEITPSMIRVRDRLTYQNLDRSLPDSDFKMLLRFTKFLRSERVQSGAVIMPRPELTVSIDANRRVTLSRRDREMDSQVIVSELMILANRLAAHTAAAANRPFPYRYQDPPKDTIPKFNGVFDPVIAYRQRRLMNRACSAVWPSHHFSLGIPEYTNITSPLRRYFDLLAQRQLKAIIQNRPTYSEEELLSLLQEVDTNCVRCIQIMSGREKYWLYKHLSGRLGQPIQAVVLDRFPNRYQIHLVEYFLDADLPRPFGIELRSGEKIQVIVDRVTPRKKQLKLRLKE